MIEYMARYVCLVFYRNLLSPQYTEMSFEDGKNVINKVRGCNKLHVTRLLCKCVHASKVYSLYSL